MQIMVVQSGLYVAAIATTIIGIHTYQSPSFKWASGVFYTYFYNHAHRLRLEKLLYLGPSRISNGFLNPLLDPGGGFTSETAARRVRK